MSLSGQISRGRKWSSYRNVETGELHPDVLKDLNKMCDVEVYRKSLEKEEITEPKPVKKASKKGDKK